MGFRNTGLPTLVIKVITGNYTPGLADANTELDYSSSSAGTLTVPPFSQVGFAVGTILSFRQIGTGALTVAAGAGVTIEGAASPSAQWTPSTSLTCVAQDTWCVG